MSLTPMQKYTVAEQLRAEAWKDMVDIARHATSVHGMREALTSTVLKNDSTPRTWHSAYNLLIRCKELGVDLYIDKACTMPRSYKNLYDEVKKTERKNGARTA